MSRLAETADREAIFNLVREFEATHRGAKPFEPGKTVIPPSGKLIDAEELVAMVDASLDGWLTAGRYNAEFERRLAKFIGVKHVLTVNSGSSANLVAFTRA